MSTELETNMLVEESPERNNLPAHEYIEVVDNVDDMSVENKNNDVVIQIEDTDSTDSVINNTALVPGDSPISIDMTGMSNDPTPSSNDITIVNDNQTQEITPAPMPQNKYDPELIEYMEITYNTLTSLVNGLNVGPDNWVLLLTKAMFVVSTVKSLDNNKKIRLSVELVIRYLDDYTTLEDAVLVSIKSSVHTMCVSILNNSGILTNKTTKPASVSGDPDLLATPLQISDLLVKKVINFVKTRDLSVAKIKDLLPELVILCVVVVEKYPHFTGLEKKNLVIQVIQTFLRDYVSKNYVATEDEKRGLDVIIQSLPFLVDTLVNVGRGKVDYTFDFNNPETLGTLSALFQCLVSCFKRRQSTTA